MMNIPQNEFLNTQALSHIFDNKSESYKLFWFKSILEHVFKGEDQISYDALVNSMLVNAWYMVSEYKLNLGPSDAVEETIKYLGSISGIKSTEKPEKLLALLENCDDTKLRAYKRRLSDNVPYRLQAPFAPETKSIPWHHNQTCMSYFNLQSGLLYKFGEWNGLDTKILIDENWAVYIRENYKILDGWTDYNLITYLQKRNPSVPGIASKIYPPQERKLSAAVAYWKAIVTAKPIQNIYTDEIMGVHDFSIDHFVPWSYVAHDELWNLIPTTKSVNSSKSNNLPAWDLYFPRLCKAEYSAYELVQEYDHMKDLREQVIEESSIKKKYDKCLKEHVNDEAVLYKLYRNNQSETEFKDCLMEVVYPAYESARKMGFNEWRYGI